MKQDVDTAMKFRIKNMKTDEYYIAQAIKEANKAYKIGEVPVGCVIVIGDEIVARSHNLRQTKHDATKHAEIIAISKACKKLNRWILDDATLYCTLEPCAMCSGAILQARIKRVVFGAFEPKFGCCGSVINIFDNDFNHKVEVTSGIKKIEIEKMMKDFFKELREKKQNFIANEKSL